MSQNGNGKVKLEQANTEVVSRARRRRYTADYKQRILAEIDAARQPGEIGAILRREGLYSQIISKWRRQLREQGTGGLEAHKRGPKANPAAAELARLQRENERLRRRLEQAELIIEVQKKVSQMLYPPLDQDDTK